MTKDLKKTVAAITLHSYTTALNKLEKNGYKPSHTYDQIIDIFESFNIKKSRQDDGDQVDHCPTSQAQQCQSGAIVLFAPHREVIGD